MGLGARALEAGQRAQLRQLGFPRAVVGHCALPSPVSLSRNSHCRLHICTACSTGFITKDLLAAHMPPPADSSLIMVCGPPPMLKAVSGDKLPDKSQGPLAGMLKDMGYTEGQVFKF